jgi:hypothetical protein
MDTVANNAGDYVSRIVGCPCWIIAPDNVLGGGGAGKRRFCRNRRHRGESHELHPDLA